MKGTIMITKVELPQELVKEALRGAINLRNRHINAATNNLIKTALQDELRALTHALNTTEELPAIPKQEKK